MSIYNNHILVFLQINLPVHHNATESTHQRERHLELL